MRTILPTLILTGATLLGYNAYAGSPADAGAHASGAHASTARDGGHIHAGVHASTARDSGYADAGVSARDGGVVHSHASTAQDSGYADAGVSARDGGVVHSHASTAQDSGYADAGVSARDGGVVHSGASGPLGATGATGPTGASGPANTGLGSVEFEGADVPFSASYPRPNNTASPRYFGTVTADDCIPGTQVVGQIEDRNIVYNLVVECPAEPSLAPLTGTAAPKVVSKTVASCPNQFDGHGQCMDKKVGESFGIGKYVTGLCPAKLVCGDASSARNLGGDLDDLSSSLDETDNNVDSLTDRVDTLGDHTRLLKAHTERLINHGLRVVDLEKRTGRLEEPTVGLYAGGLAVFDDGETHPALIVGGDVYASKGFAAGIFGGFYGSKINPVTTTPSDLSEDGVMEFQTRRTTRGNVFSPYVGLTGLLDLGRVNLRFGAGPVFKLADRNETVQSVQIDRGVTLPETATDPKTRALPGNTGYAGMGLLGVGFDLADRLYVQALATATVDNAFGGRIITPAAGVALGYTH